MIFETSIRTTIIDNKGNNKSITSRYIVENENLFSEVESKLYEEFGNETDFEVTGIKISKLKEIVNKPPQGEYKIYFATICDHFITEEGDDKELKYVVALHAGDINEAHQTVKHYMQQGLEDMELVAIKETKYLRVL